MNAYFALFLVTTWGSALSVLATFVQIDRSFGSLALTGLALGLKTAFIGLLAPWASRGIDRLGLRRSLLLSQVAGVLLLVLLFGAFHFGSFCMTLGVVLILGLPSLILGVSSTVHLRQIAKSDDQFRRLQGTIGILSGLAFLLAALCGPILSRVLGYAGMLVIDGLSYLFAIGMLMRLPGLVSALPVGATARAVVLSKSRFVFTAPDARVVRFILLSCGIYLLIGLVPLLASSGQHFLAGRLSSASREMLWSLEALAMLVAGWGYRNLQVLRRWAGLPYVLLLNSLLLVPLFYLESAVSMIASLALISIFMQLGFMRVRDDLVVQTVDRALTARVAGLAVLTSRLLMTGSPLVLLGFLGSREGGFWLIAISVGLQLLLLVSLGVLAFRQRSAVADLPVGSI